MARIPSNSITRGSTSIRSAGGNMPTNGLGAAGAAIAAGVKPINAMLDREQDKMRDNRQKYADRARRIDSAIDGVARGVDMMNKALEYRADTEATKKLAEFQEYLNRESTGYQDASGARVEGAFATPFSPGDEEGNGATGATVEMAKRIAAWREKNEVGGRTAEMFTQRAESLQEQFLQRARAIDSDNFEKYRLNAKKQLVEASIDTYLAATSDSKPLRNLAAAQAAILSMPRGAVKNYDEWMRTSGGNLDDLEFVDDQIVNGGWDKDGALRSQFDEAFRDANDAILTRKLNMLIGEAVNTDDNARSDEIFGQLSKADGEFMTPEQKSKFKDEILPRAVNNRESVVARRRVEAMGEGTKLVEELVLGKDLNAKKDIEQKLFTLAGRLAPADALKLDKYRVGLADEVDLFQFEQFRLDTMKDVTLFNLAEKKSMLMAKAQGLQSLSAREKAMAVAADFNIGMGGDSPSGKSGIATVTKEQAEFEFGCGAMTMEHALQLRKDEKIDPISFGRYWEASRKQAETKVNTVEAAENTIAAFEKWGFPMESIVTRRPDGSIKFDGGISLQYPSQPDEKRKTKFNDKKVRVTNRALWRMYSLAVEYHTQYAQGLRKDRFEEFFEKEFLKSPECRELTTIQLEDRVKAVSDRIAAEERDFRYSGWVGAPAMQQNQQEQ